MDKKSVFIRSLSYIEPVIAMAMRRTLFTVILSPIGAIMNAQTVNEFIKLVKLSQQKLQCASYALGFESWAFTEGGTDCRLTQDATYYYLCMTLPDIEQYEWNKGKSRYLTPTRRGNSKKSLILP